MAVEVKVKGCPGRQGCPPRALLFDLKSMQTDRCCCNRFSSEEDSVEPHLTDSWRRAIALCRHGGAGIESPLLRQRMVLFGGRPRKKHCKKPVLEASSSVEKDRGLISNAVPVKFGCAQP